VFHLFNHAIFKSLLFVNSAAIEQRLGTTDMNRMRGLGSRMPLTGTTSVIAALSTAGVPPLAGFWSKLIIVIALWQAHDYGYAGLAVLMSVVTLAYMLVMQRRIFFGKVSDEFAHVEEAGLGLVVPALVLAILVVAVGLLVPWVLDTFMLPVAGLF
jgi:multicomponent Na+:H+ antiporter subunit D